jgi:hypothetical protein
MKDEKYKTKDKNEPLKYFLILLLIVVFVFAGFSYWGYRIYFSKIKVENEKKFLDSDKVNLSMMIR